jgi:hypothetical protein
MLSTLTRRSFLKHAAFNLVLANLVTICCQDDNVPLKSNTEPIGSSNNVPEHAMDIQYLGNLEQFESGLYRYVIEQPQFQDLGDTEQEYIILLADHEAVHRQLFRSLSANDVGITTDFTSLDDKPIDELLIVMQKCQDAIAGAYQYYLNQSTEPPMISLTNDMIVAEDYHRKILAALIEKTPLDENSKIPSAAIMEPGAVKKILQPYIKETL